MKQLKEQQAITYKLNKIKDKLPNGEIKESVNKKLKYVNKPIEK